MLVEQPQDRLAVPGASILYKMIARDHVDAMVRKGIWREHESEIEAAYTAQAARLGRPETLWELGEMEAYIARTSQPRPVC